MFGLFQNWCPVVTLFKREKIPSDENDDEEVIVDYEKDGGIGISFDNDGSRNISDVLLSDVKVMLCAKAITYFEEQFIQHVKNKRFYEGRKDDFNKMIQDYARFSSNVTVCKTMDEIRKVEHFEGIIKVQESQHPLRFAYMNI